MKTHTILIVDHSEYKTTLCKLLEPQYSVILSDSAYDAITKLNLHDIDLIIAQVELPGDNAFDLYNYLQKHFPYIPVVMITDKNIDLFFEDIFTQGIGNVLQIPINPSEFLNLVNKLITRQNIFGLQNYIPNIKAIQSLRITASYQIQPSIEEILATIESWGFTIHNKSVVTLILNEMIINAVYHSHGYTREKELRIPITLKPDQYVEVSFCHNNSIYAIAITDFQGTLTKEKILHSIHHAIEQEQLILRASTTGEDISDKISESGRGIDLVRKLAYEFYFVIQPKRKTQIILIFDAKQNVKKTSSLKIIEDIQ